MALDLMIAIFFFFIGLEIRISLEHPKQIILPAFAALGGMVVPATIFLLIDSRSGGWATAMPTDLALALGVFALLGKGANPAVRLFLLTLAVADDLFSLLVLGAFYSKDLDLIHSSVTLGAACVGALTASIWRPAMGKVVAILAPVCTYLIIPIYVVSKFAHGFSLSDLTARPTVALVTARVIGKILGITFFAWLVIRAGIAKMPKGLGYSELIGVAALAGMGLTVSLVISEVAISSGSVQAQIRAGLAISAIISGAAGYSWLRKIPVAR
jgi:Na+:H+ antiporter, NhaA family